jgi:sugar lactone lactonase YvrE
VITLPVEYPTSCTFGGDGLDLLYVTTSRWGMQPDALASQQLAGALLVVEAGVRGTPDPRFAG